MSAEETQPSKLPVTVGVPLHGLDEAYRLSQNLSLASLLPEALRGKPSDVLAMVLYGQELGLAPMQAIQSIYVVRGKPQLSADLWTALARRAGHKVRWGACDDKTATVTIVRNDDPDHGLEFTYTLDDAVANGLVEIKDGKPYARSQSGKPTPWETYTARMLRNRAVSFCGKSQCPEVALGFAIDGDYDYIPDETPTVVERVAEAVDEAAEVPATDDPDAVAAALDAIEVEYVGDPLPLDVDA